jgi:hypothetical protein
MSITKKNAGDMDQHRVSAVYLREFGFKEGEQWKITTLEKKKRELMQRIGKRWVGEKSIDSVTTAPNEFDLKGADPDLRRLLEENFSKIETDYAKLVAEVNSGSLRDETAAKIAHFIASLLIRSKRFREVIDRILSLSNAGTFLEHMCVLMEPNTTQALVAKVMAIPIEHRLNHACVLVWHQLSIKLASFEMVVMKDYDNSGWSTSDEPVILQNNFTSNSILSIDTELWFPLSKDYCLFMYHKNSPHRQHPLRKHPHGTFIQAGEWERHVFSEFVFERAREYVFFSSRSSFKEPMD